MTLIITASRVATIGYIAGVWAFLIFVAGVALLRRWHHREHEDARETEHVMEFLAFDHTHVHEMDGWQ